MDFLLAGHGPAWPLHLRGQIPSLLAMSAYYHLSLFRQSTFAKRPRSRQHASSNHHRSTDHPPKKPRATDGGSRIAIPQVTFNNRLTVTTLKINRRLTNSYQAIYGASRFEANFVSWVPQ